MAHHKPLLLAPCVTIGRKALLEDLPGYGSRLHRLQRWRNGIELLAVESVAEGSKAIQALHYQEFHAFCFLTNAEVPQLGQRNSVD